MASIEDQSVEKLHAQGHSYSSIMRRYHKLEKKAFRDGDRRTAEYCARCAGIAMRRHRDSPGRVLKNTRDFSVMHTQSKIIRDLGRVEHDAQREIRREITKGGNINGAVYFSKVEQEAGAMRNKLIADVNTLERSRKRRA